MTDDVARKIIAIIAEQAMLEPSEVRPEATPEELGIDSLGLVEVVFAIEEAFDISVPYNANEPDRSDFDISTVGKTVEAVKRLIAEQAA
jgi:acyl carrier protein